MAFITKLRSFASAAETVPGSGVSLTDSNNNVRVWDLSIGSLNVEMDASPSKYATGDFGLGESIPGPQSAQISFTTKLWTEASGVEPAWTKFAKAAGCNTTGVAGSYVVYPSKYKVDDTLTVGIYDLEGDSTPSGLHYDFTGCIGNCTITAASTGKPYEMKWEFTGALKDIKDIAETDIPVYSGSAVIPDRFLNGTATIGSESICISSFELNFGNTISPIQCQTSETGYSQFIITNMEPMIKLNPLLKRNSDYDAWANLVDGTIEAVEIVTEQFTFNAPRCQITTMSVEDSDGVLRTALELRPLRPSSEGSYGFAPWTIQVTHS